MTRYFQAAVAIDWVPAYEAAQFSKFHERVARFLTADIHVPDSPPLTNHRTGAPLSDIVDSFAAARGFCAAAILGTAQSMDDPDAGADLAAAYLVLEEPLFVSIAAFEAAHFGYHDCCRLARAIDFGACLRILTSVEGALSIHQHDALSQALTVLIGYYVRMDRLVAWDFYRSTSKDSSMVRIGPFSVATGYFWHDLDRPRVKLREPELVSFRSKIAARMSGCGIEGLLNRIGAEPAVVEGSARQ